MIDVCDDGEVTYTGRGNLKKEEEMALIEVKKQSKSDGKENFLFLLLLRYRRTGKCLPLRPCRWRRLRFL